MKATQVTDCQCPCKAIFTKKNATLFFVISAIGLLGLAIGSTLGSRFLTTPASAGLFVVGSLSAMTALALCRMGATRKESIISNRRDRSGFFLRQPSEQPENQIGQPFQRRIPPLAPCDTVIEGESAHGRATIFTDQEITHVHTIKAEKTLDQGIEIHQSDTGHWVIQQQATRGCSAAVAAMLIQDQGAKVDISALRGTNLGSDEDVIAAIEKAGLTPIYTPNQPFKAIKDLIQGYGSAIVAVNSSAGGHYLIIDSINETSATIRDPYHGWQIDLPMATLEKVARFQSHVIQCTKSASPAF